jgi:hypothetical protein
MKKIKVIMINPFDESVSEVEIESGLESICETMQCRLIDIRYLGGEVDLIMDDEGRLKDNRWFILGGEPYAGICLLTSTDDDGCTTSTNKTSNEIFKLVEFKEEGYAEEPFMEFRPL